MAGWLKWMSNAATVEVPLEEALNPPNCSNFLARWPKMQNCGCTRWLPNGVVLKKWKSKNWERKRPPCKCWFILAVVCTIGWFTLPLWQLTKHQLEVVHYCPTNVVGYWISRSRYQQTNYNLDLSFLLMIFLTLSLGWWETIMFSHDFHRL